MTDVCRKIVEFPFTKTGGDNKILALCEFNGDFYVGIGRWGAIDSANIYRVVQNGCMRFDKVTPAWQTKTSGASMAMCVYQGYLYVGTDQAEVWRTGDGVIWQNVTGNLISMDISDMVIFQGSLYVTNYSEIWRTSGGNTWQKVVGSAFGEAQNKDIRSLAVYRNYLYAGVGRDNNKGIQLWRSKDGSQWQKYHEVIPQGQVFGGLLPGHVHALAVFQDRLYLGEYHGKGVWRYDGSADAQGTAVNVEYISDAIQIGDVFRLTEHDNKLFLGASCMWVTASGEPLLYDSVDGQTWQPVQNGIVYDAATNMVTSLFSAGQRLFIGTMNPGDSGTVALWELGSPVEADAEEPNDTLATASSITLGTTRSATSVELADLTLHSSNDVDYFEIEYQSITEDECPSFDSWPSSLGSYVYLEFHPACLTIHAQPEYCQPLQLAIYDGGGVLHKSYQTSAEIQFNCPTNIFKQKKLFVQVRPYQSIGPIRYRFRVTFSNSYGKWVRILPDLPYKFWEYMPPPYPPPPVAKIFDPATRYYDLGQMAIDAETHLVPFIEQQMQMETAELHFALGQAGQRSGRLEDAARFLNLSIVAFGQLQMAAREGIASRQLGNVLAQMGQSEEAHHCFDKAARLHRMCLESGELIKDLGSAGRQQLLLEKNYVAAIGLFEEALCVDDEHQDLLGEKAPVLLQQGQAFGALGENEGEVACLVLANEIADVVQDLALCEAVEWRRCDVTDRMGPQTFHVMWKRVRSDAAAVRRRCVARVMKKRAG